MRPPSSDSSSAPARSGAANPFIRALRAVAAVFLAAAFLVPVDAAVVGQRADAATCASANLTVTPLASSIFYSDFSPSPASLPNLAGHYTGYRITNTAGTAVDGAWVKLSNFTGGVVALAPGQASYEPLANMAPAGSGRSYFYLSASSTTAVAQTHTVSVYDRRPDLTGAVELCNTTFTYSAVTGTTQAAANKVTIATATSNPPGLGALMTMTVTGDTGTIGNGPASDPKGFDMTPAAVASGTSAWSPGAYRLVTATLNIDLTGSGATNSSDFLHYTITDPSSSARTYTITYTFVIVGTTSSNTALTPIQYIASGTQIKHTDMSGATYSAILPIQPISNTTTLSKSVSPTAITTPGGTVTYTVTATNTSGTQGTTLDDFTDTPGAGSTYVAGSSKFDGVAIGDPLASSGTLVWSGSFAVPAGTSRSLTYNVAIVSGVGSVSNSVVGHIGATVIDTTAGTADNVPATSAVSVAAAPTLNLTKTIGSRLNAADQFTVAIKNGASTVASATTSGAGTTATTGAQSLASGTTYSLTDVMAAGSVSTISQYVGTISCINSTAGSTTALASGSSAPFSITPLAGDVISCSIANAPVPTLTLVKTIAGRVVSSDQFTVAIKNGASTVASATTSGAGTSATTGSTAVAAGTGYTLTDAMAAGSTSALATYNSQIACTNAAGGSSTVMPSGTGTTFNVTPVAGDAIICTYTNTAPAPTLTLVKSLSSRHNAADQFTVAIKHGSGPTVDASHTTSGALLGGSTATTTLVAGTAYTLTDDVTAGTSTNADYDSSISCTNATAGTGTTLPSGAGNSFTVTPRAGDAISCTFDNRAKPRVTLLKSVAGRVNSADQFTVAITHGVVVDATMSTAGAAVGATTGVINLSNGTPYTLTDAMTAGSSSAITSYLSSISCTNSRAGSTTVLPSGSGTSFSLNPAFDDQITCTIINTAKPHVTLVKSVASRAVAADQFTVAIKNGASTVASVTTAGAAVSATTGATALTSATTYTLTDAMAAGSTSVIGQYASSISCTNATGGSPTVLPSGTGTSFSVTPANGDLITCTITNTAGTATLGLTKTTPSNNVVLGNVITYTYGVTNTGSLPLTNVTVTDPMSGLSAITCVPAQGSTLAFGATMSCTATYTVTQADVDASSIINTGTVTGKDPSNNTITKTASKTVTAAQSSSLTLTKAAVPSSGVVTGSVVAYTLSGTNTGTTTLHNVTVTDPLVGTLSCSPATPAILAPNATISCTGSYTVTQANVDAGSFLNTGTISGLTPANNPVSGTGSKTVTATQTSTVGLTKTAVPSSGVVAGTVVTYTFAGQNTGTVTLHNVSISDPMSGLSALSCSPSAPATLAPNATISCTATYTVTQANVDAGSYSNTATINALNPSNAAVTNTATKTVTASTTSTLGLTKAAVPSTGVVAGSVVAYTITGTNTGVTTLHNVTVSDPLIGALSCTPATPATLAPNATISCTGTYTVTQANVDAGSFLNTATINGLSPTNAPVTQTANKTVTATQTATVALTKSASPSTNVVAGTVVTYTFAGSNTGTVTEHSVTVTDPMPGLSAISCTPAAPATLAPSATISCTATRTVTQADIDAGSVVNTATIHGFDPSNNENTATASKTVTANQTSSFGFTKSASPNTGVVAGSVVTYTFVGQNTGTVTLHNVGITDPMSGLSAVSCTPAAPATLAPNATITCTATYTVTQADVDAGSIVNTATITGLNPSNATVTQTASTTVNADGTHSLSLTKTPTPATNRVAGDVVTYAFHGTNTGAVTLHNVTISDSMVGLSAITCTPASPATLAPNATINCSATYTVTQADVDAGIPIVNSATINGLDPFANPTAGTANASVTVLHAPALSIVKTASPGTNVIVGTTITYSFAGTNTGTVTLHNVGVADPMSGLSAIACAPVAPATLAPNATISCSATYTVTQADVDAGSIVNTATISGDDPSNAPTTATGGTTVTTDQTASLALTKTASPNTNVVAGDVVTYAFTGTNTGTVSIHNATITDAKPGLSALSCTPAQGSTLATNATITCTATYTVTQVDVDTGSFTNTASITGADPSNNPISATGSATVTTNTASTVTFTKTVTPSSNRVAGDVVAYQLTTKNTGARTLLNTSVTDPLPGLSAITCSPAQGSPLAPSATQTCSATYTVTQADVDNGGRTNTATFQAGGTLVPSVNETASATFTTNQTPGISLSKTASPSSGVVAGDTVAYTFVGTNTGTVTLHGVVITDPMPGLTNWNCTPASPAIIAPSATETCTADYVVTQADVDAGAIVNSASITGTDPNNAVVTDTAGATVTATQTPGLTFTKTATPNANVVAGTVVTYTFAGTNSGNVTLHNVGVTDPMTGLSAIGCSPSAPATLAPGDAINCNATRTVTQADVDAGSIVNTATLAGLTPQNTAITKTTGATVTANTAASLSLVKSATPNSSVNFGDVVSYSFAGTNTGQVTLHNVGVTDPMAGLSAIGCTRVAPATLAPNATIHCTATYTVTQADVDAGQVLNTATVTGTDPNNNPVTNTASATVTANQTATLTLSKSGSFTNPVVAGSVVGFTIDAINTGTVTLTNVGVTDPLLGGGLTCSPTPPATLAPGGTMQCTGSYTVTQADVDAGSVVNSATVDATDPNNNPVTKTAGATVPTSQTASFGFTKSATPTSVSAAGDTITYSFDGTNTGTTTLHNVNVTDPMVGLGPIVCVPATVATLAPNATIHCTASYTATQADIDAGQVLNTATISGKDPNNNPASKTAGTTVTVAQYPSLTMTKSASPSTNVVAGIVVTYTFAGANNGNVTLHNVHVTDPLTGLSAITCTPAAPATLAPAATITCTATYTVTQADVDAGSIDNTATVDGLDPSNAPITNTASATVTTDATAAVTLTKSAVPTSGLFVGDTVTYTMTATNSGAVSLHNVAVTDPMVGLSALSCTPPAGSTLGSGATMTCTGTYAVTQTDVDAASISNTATVTGDDPGGNPVTDTASKTILAGQTASVQMVKTATPNSGVVAGDTVTYGFDVTNNGTVSIHNVTVADPMAGLSTLTCAPSAPATLAPNAIMHCDATYTVTRTNVNDGPFTNTATVTGLDTVNNPVSDSASASVTPNSTTGVDLVKTVSPEQNVTLGTLLTYTMTATNTGTTTLEATTISDPMPGLSALTCTPAEGSDLAPGVSMTCTGTYTVTATDVKAGEILNDATVTGHNLNGQTVSHAAAATVPTASSGTTGTLTIDKQLEGVTDSVATWNITVTNPGPGTHPGPFTLTDPLPSGLSYESVSGVGWSCSGTATVTCIHAGDLAVGAATVITLKTKIVSGADITNTASLDVGGTILTSKATYHSGSGFAFTGAEAQRLGVLGLLGVLGGWFIVIAARKRRDEDSAAVVD